MEQQQEDKRDENEAQEFLLQLVVTEEQRAVIEALFGHNNWDYKEVWTERGIW